MFGKKAYIKDSNINNIITCGACAHTRNEYHESTYYIHLTVIVVTLTVTPSPTDKDYTTYIVIPRSG